MRVAVNGYRLVQDWKTGAVSQGAKPAIKAASSPRPRSVWNGNPFCDPGCILYLPGLPGSGATIHDYSGQGNPGTIDGATWTRLSSGLWLLDFDGATNKVVVNDVPGLSALSKMTLIAWIKSDISGAYKGIISKGGEIGTREWFMTTQDINNFRFGLRHSDTVGYLLAAGTADVATSGAWFQVAGTWNGANAIGSIVLYVNGAVDTLTVNTKSTTGFVPWDSGSNVEIGRNIEIDAYCFDGKIALPRIYNRVLSALEVLNLYRQERHLFGI